MGNREHHRAFVLAVISDRNREIFACTVIIAGKDALQRTKKHFAGARRRDNRWHNRYLLPGGGLSGQADVVNACHTAFRQVERRTAHADAQRIGRIRPRWGAGSSAGWRSCGCTGRRVRRYRSRRALWSRRDAGRSPNRVGGEGWRGQHDSAARFIANAGRTWRDHAVYSAVPVIVTGINRVDRRGEGVGGCAYPVLLSPGFGLREILLRFVAAMTI